MIKINFLIKIDFSLDGMWPKISITPKFKFKLPLTRFEIEHIISLFNMISTWRCFITETRHFF